MDPVVPNEGIPDTPTSSEISEMIRPNPIIGMDPPIILNESPPDTPTSSETIIVDPIIMEDPIIMDPIMDPGGMIPNESPPDTPSHDSEIVSKPFGPTEELLGFDMEKVYRRNYAMIVYHMAMTNPEEINVFATSCGIWPARHKFRSTCVKIADSRPFGAFILTIVIINSILMALDPPSITDPGFQKVTDIIDNIFLAFFVVEMLLKIVGMGFIAHRDAYLRQAWNILDFTIVIAGIAGLFSNQDGGGLAALRVIRVMRPLRTVGKIRPLRLVIQTLLEALPLLRDIFTLLFFYLMAFATFGLHVWSDDLHNRCFAYVDVNHTSVLVVGDTQVCSTTTADGRMCHKNGLALKQVCHQHHAPNHFAYNFDNIGNALLLVFRVISLDGWAESMTDICNSVGKAAFIFCLMITLLGGYMCINLIIAVLSTTYSKESKKPTFFSVLEAKLKAEKNEQTDKNETPGVFFARLMLTSVSGVCLDSIGPYKVRIPEKAEADDDNTVLTGLCACLYKPYAGPLFLYNIVVSRYFNIVVLTVTFMNAVVLSFDHYGISDEMSRNIGYISVALSVFFLADAAIKIIALGIRRYFADFYNGMDFVLCVFSLPDLVSGGNHGGEFGSLNSLRAVRLFRALRLAHNWSSLQKLLNTITASMAAAMYLSLIMILVIYIFSILGFQLFGTDMTGMRMSFSSVPESIITVVLVISQSGWSLIMQTAIEQTSFEACVYFVSLLIVGNFVIVNLFVAIILHFFSEQSASTVAAERQAHLEKKAKALALKEGRPYLEEEEEVTPPPTKKNPVSFRRPQVAVPYPEEEEAVVTTPVDLGSLTDLTPCQRRAIEKEVDLCKAVLYKWPYQEAVNLDSLTPSQRMKRDRRRGAVSGWNRAYGSSPRTPVLPVLPVLERALSINVPYPEEEEMRQLRHPEAVPKAETSSIPSAPDDDPEYVGAASRAFYFLEPNNRIRNGIIWVLKARATNYFILLCIISSSVLLALDSPAMERNNPALAEGVRDTDIAFAIVFLVEAIMKLVAMGVVAHPGAYFRSVWNISDFIVVVISFLCLDYPGFKVGRALRCTRLLSRSARMRLTLTSLVQSMPGITNVIFLGVLVWWIFGIVGVSLFKGGFYGCTDASIMDEKSCVGVFNLTEPDLLGRNITYVKPRQWLNLAHDSFDDIGQAMICLTRIATKDGWYKIMYAAIDSQGPHLGPKRNANQTAALYFIFFLVVGGFFMINLFIGVLVDRFAEMKARGEGSAFMTSSQKKWVLTQRVVLRTRLEPALKEPENCIRKRLFHISLHPWFEHFFTFAIVVNVIVLASKYRNSSDEVESIINIMSLVLLILFTMEGAIKISAVGFPRYISDSWNKFDVLVVTVSWIATGIGGSGTSVVRIFRVGRLFMLIKRAKGLHTLISTLGTSIPAFMNTLFLMLVVYFMFAIVGVELYGYTPRNDVFDNVLNFEEVGSAIITLYVVATSGWADVARATGVGSSYIYIMVFMWIGSFILLNLLVTVITSAFTETTTISEHAKSIKHFDVLKERWIMVDQKATQKMHARDCLPLIFHLPEPLWCHALEEVQSLFILRLRQLSHMHIPVSDTNVVRYSDVVAALALTVFDVSIEDALDASKIMKGSVKWEKNHKTILYYFASTYLQEAWKSRKARRAEKERRKSSCVAISPIGTDGGVDVSESIDSSSDGTLVP